MRTTSVITGKTYNSDEVVYIGNHIQFRLYIKHDAGQYLVDILYNSRHPENPITYVFLKNKATRELYRQWNEHTLK